MVLSFSKTEEGDVTVQFKNGDEYEEFSYCEMIKKIYVDKCIEDAEIIGDFSDVEKTSISELVDELRAATSEGNSDKETAL